jgi:peroxiredoxin family protein/TusA-related sulfurtransferase/rhodanese-related sulfurtransferase
MAGFVAENVLSGRSDVIVPENIENIDFNTTTLVDLRSPLEVANGAIDGHINIPVDELRSRLNELDKEKEIWVYCQVGLRGYIGERILKQNGFKVKNLTGGYKTYSMSRFKPKAAESRKEVRREVAADKYDKTLDACGLCCPGPLMQVKATMDELNEGEKLKVTASDPGFYEDINSWCMRTNNDLLERKMDKGIITALIMKGTKLNKVEQNLVNNKDNKTIVVFDGDLDKAIAAFIIANGAASMGKKVTMFFTFWGLNILRREEKVNVKKGFMDRMFGAMMPRGSKKLKLSNMNMMGMGAKMIRKVMKDKNVTSLEDLITSAVDSGIQIVACQMSMDVMGIRKEELIDGVKIGGVGYYLGEAEDANVNLFV